MKKKKHIMLFTAIAALLSLTVACSTDDEFGDDELVGTPVSFSAGTIDTETRVIYSSTTAESAWTMNWSQNQDAVYIYCPEASTTMKESNSTKATKKYALYRGTADTSDATKMGLNFFTTAVAGFNSNNEANGICWGSAYGGHNFYSLVYDYNSNKNVTKTDVSNLSSATLKNREDGSVYTITFPSIFYYNETDKVAPFIMYGKTSAAVKPTEKEKAVQIKYKNLTTVFDITVKSDASTSITIDSIQAYIRKDKTSTSSNEKYKFRILGGNFYVDLTSDTTLVLAGNDNSPYCSGLSKDTSFPTVATASKSDGTLGSVTSGTSLNTKIFLPLTEAVDKDSEIVIIGIKGKDSSGTYGSYYIPLTLNKNITPGTIVPIKLEYSSTLATFWAVANEFITAVGTKDDTYFTMNDWGTLD